MRTLHIRAKSFGVPLLVAVSAVAVWTSVISMRTMAEVQVPARFAHRTIAVDTGFLRIIVVIFVVVIINIAIGIVVTVIITY
jgi:hypothetical protein